ncbi:G-protein alpha subunit family protein [Heterostelium album PN500]|uniref:G-protein alpha subunit family protein n=1 Tax=Heterostelium pallidum (strain ATCC 26659 / Pp 5 / PN500) TaxID=670386 RepID=D3BIL2_HETP5|nr:G-protein alpha subunit family protein [Heterostelium album PN500]EFA78636.1 G-protein alpha subunit family protein [Heterostelium album PN500]|eukprot:XP_020430760.1 G-protein alpha subunit family protein [Heterostelium album PN500]
MSFISCSTSTTVGNSNNFSKNIIFNENSHQSSSSHLNMNRSSSNISIVLESSLSVNNIINIGAVSSNNNNINSNDTTTQNNTVDDFECENDEYNGCDDPARKDEETLVADEKQLQLLQLRETLIARADAARILSDQRSRLSVSNACKDIDDPLTSESASQGNPYKKTSGSSKSSDRFSKAMEEIVSRSSNDMVAYGLGESRLDSVLNNIKIYSGVNDYDRMNYNNHMIDMAIQILRLLVSYIFQHYEPKQRYLPPEKRSNPKKPTFSLNNNSSGGGSSNSILINNQSICNDSKDSINLNTVLKGTKISDQFNSKKQEILAKLIRIKNDPYGQRPIPPLLLAELKVLWTDPVIQELYKAYRPNFIKSYQILIDKYSVMDRVFGSDLKLLDDNEILQLVEYPINQIPEYIISGDIRITDVSSINVRKMDRRWMKTFSDVKAFIWCCSLATFDEIAVNPIFVRTKSTTSVASITPQKSSKRFSNSMSSMSFTYYNNEQPTPMVNSLHQSIQIFRTLSQHTHTPSIIFFTEKERFTEKIQSGAKFKSHFPDYTGQDKDINQIMEFIKKQFNPPNDSYSAIFHTSSFDGKEDSKVITTVLLNIATKDTVDIFI